MYNHFFAHAFGISGQKKIDLILKLYIFISAESCILYDARNNYSIIAALLLDIIFLVIYFETFLNNPFKEVLLSSNVQKCLLCDFNHIFLA